MRDGARVIMMGTYLDRKNDRLMRSPVIVVDGSRNVVDPKTTEYTVVSDGPLPDEPAVGSVVVKDGQAWAHERNEWIPVGVDSWESLSWAELSDGTVVHAPDGDE
jgi:hypothetical protein